MNLVESTGATVAALPLGRDAGNSSDVMMMSSSLEETHQEETEKQKESSQRETCAAEKGEEEGGEKEGGEKEGGVGGVASPQVDDRDPKLVKALEKMRRLDKKLADIVMVRTQPCLQSSENVWFVIYHVSVISSVPRVEWFYCTFISLALFPGSYHLRGGAAWK